MSQLTAMLLLAAILSPTESTGAKPKRAELVFTLEVEKNAFVLHEPVTVSYSVKNPTT